MYPEGTSISGYNHPQSKPPVGRPVAYLFARLNGTTPFLVYMGPSARFFRTVAVVLFALRAGMVHERFE